MANPTDNCLNTVTFSTHNLQGLNNSKVFLHSQCDDYPYSIYAVQEHWLRPSFKKAKGVNQLQTIHPNFDGWGTSGMTKSCSTKVTKGRCFGGTGFLWNRKYAQSIRPRTEYKHDRVSVLQVDAADGPLLCISAYMPYFSTNNLEASLKEYHDVCGFIAMVMASNDEFRFIIMTDMNCNYYDTRHPYTKILTDLMGSHNLINCFDLLTGTDVSSLWTRSGICGKNRKVSKTLIDGIFVSHSLTNRVSNVRIDHCADNLSDHSPVKIDLNLELSFCEVAKHKPFSFISWEKLNVSTLDDYRSNLTNALSTIDVDSTLIHHADCICDDETHK